MSGFMDPTRFQHQTLMP